MVKLNFFYRRKNPVFYSIEQVFQGIAREIAEHYSAEFEIASQELPYFSKLDKLWRNIRFAAKRQGGVNHMTGDAHYAMLGFSRRHVNVLTIHDCVLLNRFSRMDPRYWIIKWLWYDLPVRKADAVCVISESTRKDLLAHSSCDPRKLRVIPNYIDADFQFDQGQFNEDRPAILFIGTTPNKNLERLCMALEGISCRLDIVGELTPAQELALSAHRIDYTRASRLGRDALIELYKRCDMVAFPSTFEGFGLPIIEAQAIGRPLLTSNLSPMREVAGAGACLADPYDPGSIREGIMRIISDENYRRALVGSGLKNVAGYSLMNVTKQYTQLYKELWNQKNRVS